MIAEDSQTVEDQASLAVATDAPSCEPIVSSREVAEQARQLVDLLDLILYVQVADDVPQACTQLVERLASQLDMQCVAISIRQPDHGPCRMRACHGPVSIENRPELVDLFESAMDEAILRNALTVCPSANGESEHATLAHQNLVAQIGAAFVATCPIVDELGHVSGVLLLMDGDLAKRTPNLAWVFESTAQRVGPSLATFNKRQPSAITRLGTAIYNRVRPRTRKAIGMAALILVAVMAIPMPYRVRCNVEVQPAQRRFVVAPFDGKLDHNLAEIGEVVQQGQSLALMDGREIRWELSALTADYERARKGRDVAMANRSTADAQKAKLEMERLDHQRRLLTERSDNLTVASPIDGLVIQSSLEDAGGAPLDVGQLLFEVAPLDEVKFEIGIPESKIAHVRSNVPVTITLDAFPGRVWRGHLQNIHPRAEIRGDESVFIAVVAFANDDGLLRPGMKGRVVISGESAPLAWNLMQDTWRSIVAKIGW
jgi:hypothetical protein